MFTIDAVAPFSLCWLLSPCPIQAFTLIVSNRYRQQQNTQHLDALTKYFENDLVSVHVNSDAGEEVNRSPRLYVVTADTTISPLCTHEDDNPTDLHIDPRSEDGLEIDDESVVKCYGEGWYSQRVVPSLGGGPGYGAEANPIWSIEEAVLTQLQADQVEIPILDLGIAHGEKARSGAI